jgi:hypothetical protein
MNIRYQIDRYSPGAICEFGRTFDTRGDHRSFSNIFSILKNRIKIKLNIYINSCKVFLKTCVFELIFKNVNYAGVRPHLKRDTLLALKWHFHDDR